MLKKYYRQLIIFKNHFKVLIFCLPLLCVSEKSLAEIYTWVDEYGKTHMTDRAPTSSESTAVKTIKDEEIRINTVSEQGSVKQNRQQLLQSFKSEEEQRLEKEKAQLKQDANLEKKCKKLRLRLQKLKDGWRFFSMDDKGEKQYMDEASREQKTALLEEQLKKCP